VNQKIRRAESEHTTMALSRSYAIGGRGSNPELGGRKHHQKRGREGAIMAWGFSLKKISNYIKIFARNKFSSRVPGSKTAS